MAKQIFESKFSKSMFVTLNVLIITFFCDSTQAHHNLFGDLAQAHHMLAKSLRLLEEEKE